MEDKDENNLTFLRLKNSRICLYCLGLFIIAVVGMTLIILTDHYFRAELKLGKGWSDSFSTIESLVSILIWGGGGLLLGAVWLLFHQAWNMQLQKQALSRLEHELKKGWEIQKLLDQVNDAVIFADQNYRITLWNRAAERMYGWTVEQAVGQTAPELLRNKFSQASRAHVRQQLDEL